MNRIIQLVIGVVVCGLIALFLRWVMSAMGVPDIAQTIVWILFVLFLLLAVLGLLGYGPLRGNWWSQ